MRKFYIWLIFFKNNRLAIAFSSRLFNQVIKCEKKSSLHLLWKAATIYPLKHAILRWVFNDQPRLEIGSPYHMLPSKLLLISSVCISLQCYVYLGKLYIVNLTFLVLGATHTRIYGPKEQKQQQIQFILCFISNAYNIPLH